MHDTNRTIREMADEYAELTGENIFLGVEHPDGGVKKFMFTDGMFTSQENAFAHMKERLLDAREDK